MTEIQKIHIELIKKVSFNNFDGIYVANDLIKNKNLWHAVIMDRVISRFRWLLKLRDVEKNLWHVDTMYILSTNNNDKKLESLAMQDWCASSIRWHGRGDAANMLGMFGEEIMKNDNVICEIYWN